ncbi:MAG: hypothetical protein QOH16_3528 [Gaiellaceae bacterium]|jgi:hypothetical protein|nr:hypothetical protein [Gaiellaceae bacterium]
MNEDGAGEGSGDTERLSFLDRELPGGFSCRSVTIAERSERVYDESEWADTFVVVEEGALEVECLGGSRACFASGSILCFQRLGLRTLRNPGNEPVLLTAISRRLP